MVARTRSTPDGHKKTPMGEVLSNRPGDRSFLGGGRRASTLRALVRASKKYLAWLAVSADVAFPSEVSHLTGFLESRHSEPCNRGALKAAHQYMAFLEDVAAIDEKLATAQPARTPGSMRGGCSFSGRPPRTQPGKRLRGKRKCTGSEIDPFEDHWCRPKPLAQVGCGFRTLLCQEAEQVVLWLAGALQESGLSAGPSAPSAFRELERLPTT